MHADGSRVEGLPHPRRRGDGVGAAGRAAGRAAVGAHVRRDRAPRGAARRSGSSRRASTSKLAAYEQILRDAGLAEDAVVATWATTCWTCRCSPRGAVGGAGRCGARRSAQRVHWVSAAGGGRGAVARADRAGAARAGPLGRRRRRTRRNDSDGSLDRVCSARWSRCSPAWRSARRGSATSCRTAAGSIGAARASRRTTCSGSTSSSPTRSIRRSRS